MIEYKGYVGKVEFDAEDEVFHGSIINIDDTVTFAGKSVGALKKAFRDSVEDYLAYCAARGEKPDKPYSGALRLRIDPSLHRRAATAAAKAGKSLNRYIVESVERALRVS
ncbi:MAG TPA: type II toxin-antitoxin system HicB family antitoxin [Candidatus Hydrogenedentes bacterium]|nr:type II toxin-antitoxin system HicB family antitoxin [Candidatus Hydrogenedentota bacterium]